MQGGGASGHSPALERVRQCSPALLTYLLTSSDCTLAAGAEKNIGFYEKCGYVVKEVSMAKYLDH